MPLGTNYHQQQEDFEQENMYFEESTQLSVEEYGTAP